MAVAGASSLAVARFSGEQSPAGGSGIQKTFCDMISGPSTRSRQEKGYGHGTGPNTGFLYNMMKKSLRKQFNAFHEGL